MSNYKINLKRLNISMENVDTNILISMIKTILGQMWVFCLDVKISLYLKSYLIGILKQRI